MGKEASDLPNVASLLRASARLDIGTKTNEYYEDPYFSWFKGEISKVPDARQRGGWTIKYNDGGHTLLVTDEEEMRRA
eukprot:scaffold14075_cov21-Tisochrysis_lutea.AAC.1